jgi:enterochelin esterase-like enzyme
MLRGSKALRSPSAGAAVGRLAGRQSPLYRRRLLLAAVCLAWVVGGGLGLYSYLENYYVHRGFPTPSRLARARAGRLYTLHFYSPALHRRADYQIYLPGGYTTSRRYPTFYLLHGTPGRPQFFTTVVHIEIRMENLVSRRRMPPMILVFPDGQINGDYFSDSEWANTRAGRFESYVTEVVQQVDRHFAARASRRARVIGGYSEGGYGALNIALHHLSLFGSVQAWSGYYVQTRASVFSKATPSQLFYNSPLEYVRRLERALARDHLRVFLYGGRSDPTSRQMGPMARALRRRGAHVGWAIYPGGHNWQLWIDHVDQMLVLAGRDVGRSPADPPPLSRAASAAGDASLPGSSRNSATAWGTAVGLILAVLSAAMINLGFLLQHRGLRAVGQSAHGTWPRVRCCLRTPSWVGGQALGWTGFALQVLALTIAPLSLVQAFAAGGLALSVPTAAWLFSYRISRSQLGAVLVTAGALAVLPLGLLAHHEHLRESWLGLSVAAAMALGVIVALVRRPALWAVAAGLFYGTADAGIKAVALRWAVHGPAGLVSPWSAVVIIGTFAGFLAFQVALGRAGAIAAISLMNALAAVVAVVCGVAAFGESFGRGAGVALHTAALGLVLGCVPVLAAAQDSMAAPGGGPETSPGQWLPGASEPAPAGPPDAGQDSADSQRDSLQPGPGSRNAAPQHTAQLEVARQGK